MKNLMTTLFFCMIYIAFAVGQNCPAPKKLNTDQALGKWEGACSYNGEFIDFTLIVNQENGQLTSTVDIPKLDIQDMLFQARVCSGQELHIKNSDMEFIGKPKENSMKGKVIFRACNQITSEEVFTLKKTAGSLSSINKKENKTLSNGDKMPAFNLIAYNGTSIDNSKLQGNYYMIDFWATWCKPCVQKRSKLETIKRKMGDKLQIVSIALDNNANIVEKFRKTKYNMPWYHVVLSKKFNDPFTKKYLQGDGIPFGYLVDEKGTIVALGSELSSGNIESTVSRVLNR